MLVDLTLRITEEIYKSAVSNEKMASVGHLGTHFDVMNKEFPLEYTNRTAVVFDVRNVICRDISDRDIDISLVKPGMLVAFNTGYIKRQTYGSELYFSSHPQLSDELIHNLIKRKISLIGIDCAGIRRGKEHTPKDQYCADNGVFVIENLCNLDKIIRTGFTAHIYPVNFADMTGLPCRVVAEF